MFTGIIEDIGKIVEIKNNFIFFETKLDDLNIKDSIAVNGVCLTIIEVKKYKEKYIYKVEVSKETLNRTNLKFLKLNSLVNLERAIKLNSRLSGHILTGHIDTTINIAKILDEEFVFSLPYEYERYVVEKGSLAIDGISLTVAKKFKDKFSVIILPYTLENTNLKTRKVGDCLNLEVDILAKYLESIFNKKDNKLDFEFLKKHGFV
ncbi:MAG: riboflavin synthase [Endomicrobiia bacterium]